MKRSNDVKYKDISITVAVVITSLAASVLWLSLNPDVTRFVFRWVFG